MHTFIHKPMSLYLGDDGGHVSEDGGVEQRRNDHHAGAEDPLRVRIRRNVPEAHARHARHRVVEGCNNRVYYLKLLCFILQFLILHNQFSGTSLYWRLCCQSPKSSCRCYNILLLQRGYLQSCFVSKLFIFEFHYLGTSTLWIFVHICENAPKLHSKGTHTIV